MQRSLGKREGLISMDGNMFIITRSLISIAPDELFCMKVPRLHFQKTFERHHLLKLRFALARKTTVHMVSDGKIPQLKKWKDFFLYNRTIICHSSFSFSPFSFFFRSIGIALTYLFISCMSQKKRGAKSRRTQKVYQCTGYGNCIMTFTRSEQLVRHLKRHRDEV